MEICHKLNTLLLVLFCGIFFSGEAYSQDFQAATTKKDITPLDSKYLLGYSPRKSTGVHDRIYHRIVVLDDGKSQFYLISSDLCLISPSLYDQVADLLKGKYGIEPSNFWWSVTHTHSAPEVGPPGLPAIFLGERYEHGIDTTYTNKVVDKLLEGIEEVKSRLQPAQLGVGWGYSQANINRRAQDADGSVSLGMNPDGPTDRRIGILKITRESDNSLLTLIANYPIHGTVMGSGNTLISGDAPGIVSKYLEEELGAPILFINGAAGNIAPIYSVYPSPQAGHLNQFKVMLGDKIIKAQQQITSEIDEVTLNFGKLMLRIPRKEGLGWPTDLSDYSYENDANQNMIKLPIQFLKINEDIAVWNAPLELFSELSNEIREKSPFPYTFYYGYTNGWMGYMPTEQAFENGGYEPSVSPYVPSAGRELVKGVSAYLQGELKSK